jgi:hypothetical protein
MAKPITRSNLDRVMGVSRTRESNGTKTSVRIPISQIASAHNSYRFLSAVRLLF